MLDFSIFLDISRLSAQVMDVGNGKPLFLHFVYEDNACVRVRVLHTDVPRYTVYIFTLLLYTIIYNIYNYIEYTSYVAA